MSKDKWSALSAEERAQLINIYVQSGITDLDFIKKDYNSFDEGGSIEYTIPSPKDDIEVPYRSVITEDMRNNFITKSKNKFDTFVNRMYPIIERTLIEKELPTDNLHNVLKQMAHESDYGLNPRGNGYNLSGIKAWDDDEGTKFDDGNYYRDFKDYRDYADFYIDLLNNRYNALDAKDTNDYIYRLHHGKDGKSYSADEAGYKRNLTRMYSLDKAIKKYETNSAKGVRILDGSTEENQTLDNTPWYKKVSNALIEGARMGRDARIGAVGAEPLREMYASGQSEEADRLAKQYVRANTAGIGIGAGAASSSLLADLLTTAGTTAIDTTGDGDIKNLSKNVAKNAIGDLLGFGAGKALNHFIDLDIIKKAFKDGRLRIGEPTTYTAYHQSDNPITQFTFPYKKRWDVVTHGADPNAAFFTVDTPATSGFLSKRPYTSKFDVTVQRPLVQTGEINGTTKNSMRNKIVKRARKLGADGVLFEGIADNQLQNQRILMAFDNSDIKFVGGPGKVRYFGPTMGKTTFVKANPDYIDLDSYIKNTRTKAAELLGLEVSDPRVSQSPIYKDAFRNRIIEFQTNNTNKGKTLLGSQRQLLSGDFVLDDTPLLPDFATFVERNQSRGFRETPEQLRSWYNGILKLKPDIKIDNRYISDIISSEL